MKTPGTRDQLWPLTRVADIARILGFANVSVRDLCDLRMVHSSWRDVIDNYAYDVWGRSLVEDNLPVLLRKGDTEKLASAYGRRDLRFDQCIRTVISTRHTELYRPMIPMTFMNTCNLLECAGDWARGRFVSSLVEKADVDAIRLLAEVGLDFQTFGSDPFEWLATNPDRWRVVQLLLALGARPCPERVYIDLVQNPASLDIYVNGGIEVNETKTGQLRLRVDSLLRKAVAMPHDLETIRRLLDVGCNPCNPDDQPSPLMYATQKAFHGVVALLIGHGIGHGSSVSCDDAISVLVRCDIRRCNRAHWYASVEQTFAAFIARADIKRAVIDLLRTDVFFRKKVVDEYEYPLLKIATMAELRSGLK